MKIAVLSLSTLLITSSSYAGACNSFYYKFYGNYTLDSESSTPNKCVTEINIKENNQNPCEQIDIEHYVGNELIGTETIYFNKTIEHVTSTGERFRVRTKMIANNSNGISTTTQKQVFPGVFMIRAIRNIWSTTGAANLFIDTNEEDKFITKCFYKRN